MAKKAGLQLIISLVDEATSGLQKITGGMKGLALVGGAAVVVGMVAVGKAAWDAGQVYDEAMDTIITKTGASGDALAVLENDFKTVFSSVPTDAKTAADVIAEFNRTLGMSGPVLQDTSKSLLEMTRLLKGDAKTSAAQFSEVMQKWGIPVEQGSLALDKLFVASQKTGVGVDTLMNQVLRFGAPLQQFGYSFDEATAIIAEFERTGVNTEQAMGGLTKALSAFAKAGKDPEAALNDLVAQIKTAGTSSEATKLAVTAFGAKAGPELATAIREGRLSIDDLTAAMGNAEGAIMKTADATNDFPEKFQVLRNKVTTLLMPLGNLMVTGLSAAVDAIGPAIDGAIAWIEKIAGEGTALGNLWSTLQSIAQTVWPQVQAVIMAAVAMIDSVLGAHADGLNNKFGPAWTKIQAIIERVWPVIQGIIAAGVAIVQGFLDAHGTEIVAFMQTAWDKISEIINLAWQLISAIIAVAAPAIQKVIVPVFEAIRNFLQEHGDTIMAILGAAWDVIRSAIEIALALIKGIIQVALAVVQGDWSGAWEAIKVMATSVWESIKTIIGAALTIIQSVVKIALDVIQGSFQRTWDAIKSLTNSALGALRSAISGALSAIKSSWEGTWNSLKNFVSSVWNSIKSTVNAGLAAVVNALASVRLPNPFAVLQGFIDAARKAIDDFINWLRNLKIPNPFANFKLPTLPFGANAITIPEPASQGRVLFAGVGAGAAGAARRESNPGNTFVFNFAAPATAYDERKIETSVQQAMLRAGVRADAIRRTR